MIICKLDEDYALLFIKYFNFTRKVDIKIYK